MKIQQERALSIATISPLIMATREEIQSEKVVSGQDDDFHKFVPTRAALSDQPAFRVPRTSEIQPGIWRKEEPGDQEPELLEADGGQDQQKNCPAPCCILFAPSPGRPRRL